MRVLPIFITLFITNIHNYSYTTGKGRKQLTMINRILLSHENSPDVT